MIKAITHNELKAQLYKKSLELSNPRLLGCLTVAREHIDEFQGICYFLWSLEILSEQELDSYNEQYWKERDAIDEELHILRKSRESRGD